MIYWSKNSIQQLLWSCESKKAKHCYVYLLSLLMSLLELVTG